MKSDIIKRISISRIFILFEIVNPFTLNGNNLLRKQEREFFLSTTPKLQIPC